MSAATTETTCACEKCGPNCTCETCTCEKCNHAA